jgi:hypothetical protein
MVPKEKLISDLREELKKQRDLLLLSGDPELVLIAQSLNTYLLCSYDPSLLIQLGETLSAFLNKHIGGQN